MCLVPFFFCNLRHIFLYFLVCILVDAQLVLYLLFGFTPVDTDNRPSVPSWAQRQAVS